MRLMTDRFVTLLPDPDSPTIPRVFAAVQIEAHSSNRLYDTLIDREIFFKSFT
jgi:hypothetical protein